MLIPTKLLFSDNILLLLTQKCVNNSSCVTQMKRRKEKPGSNLCSWCSFWKEAITTFLIYNSKFIGYVLLFYPSEML